MEQLHKPRKQPIQKRSRETVEAIYEAAAQVFSKMGYAATTTDRIAERAGVSIGSLYQYFPNKDSIVMGLMERHLTEGKTRLEKAIIEGLQGEMTFECILKQIIEELVIFHEKDPGLMRVFLNELPHNKEIMHKSQAMMEYFTGMVELLIRNNPAARVKNPKVAAHLVTIAAETLTHEIVCYHYDEFDRDEFIDEMSHMLRRYLFSE